ncbi:MAG TPA: hypothetical protein VFL31_06540 [Nitrospiraceae bacterium]|nr:hypothetical protein [Nitrospiraceae bacterium]
MPDNVRDTFDQLRQFAKGDIGQILAQEQGGNYAAALLIAAVCEGLSRLLDQPENSVLIQLLAKHGLSQTMAADVADALRQGLAHVYDTKYIQAGKLKFELVVSWGKKPHLETGNAAAIYSLRDKGLLEIQISENTPELVAKGMGTRMASGRPTEKGKNFLIELGLRFDGKTFVRAP